MLAKIKRSLYVLVVLTVSGGGCGDDGNDNGEDESTLSDAGAQNDAGKDAQNDGEANDASAIVDARTSDASARDASARDAANPAGSGDAGAKRDAEVAGNDAQTAPGNDQERSGPSSGCGKSVPSGAGKFTKLNIRAADRDRSYQLYLPQGYDPQRAYPVVFRFHGSTGNGLSGGLDIQNVAAKDLIVVSPDGLNATWSQGNTDIALFDALVAQVESEYCVDRGKLFSYGFSAGAGFAELLSCIRGDTLRGVGAIEGYEWARGKTCEGPVAAWLLHDSSDTAAPIAGGKAARDRLLAQNGCSNDSETAGTSCVRYLGCSAGQPVVWCETSGRGHDIRGDYNPGEFWKFIQSLP